jgi:Eukaryotic translation initiation factor eIF2A
VIGRLALALRESLDLDAIATAEVLWLATEQRHNVASARSAQPARDAAPGMATEGGGAAAITTPQQPRPTPPADRPQQPAESQTETFVRQAARPRSLAASAVRIPTAAALPRPLEIGRALRPFARPPKSKRNFVVDPERTAENSADAGILVPVMRAREERWFDVAIVVDDDPAMPVWRSTVRELTALFARQGAFRDVRRWTLRSERDALRLEDERGQAHATRELLDPTSRRLILIVTDGTARLWSTQAAITTLGSWAKTTPTAFLQLLPPRLWGHTWTKASNSARTAARSGAPNSVLNVVRDWWDDAPVRELPVPVIALDAASIEAWARGMTGRQTRVPVTVLSVQDVLAPSAVVAPEDRVSRFKALVSTQAYRLAVDFSAIPLSLPVMRLVQAAGAPSSSVTHLAEFFLGGLVTATDGEDAECVFEFREGVREVLQHSLTTTDLFRVLATASRYIGEHFGETLDFSSLYADEQGSLTVSPEARPFATIATSLLHRFGYAAPRSARRESEDSPPEQRPEPRRNEATVLVAGDTTRQLPRRIAQVAAALGSRLGKEDYVLYTGARSGVDDVIWKAFESDAKDERGKRLSAKTYSRRALEADIAVVIAGQGGTYDIAGRFRGVKKPVLPIARTGGAAQRVYNEMSNEGATFIDRGAFELLAAPVDDEVEAAAIADDLVLLAGVLTNPDKLAAYSHFAFAVYDILRRFGGVATVVETNNGVKELMRDLIDAWNFCPKELRAAMSVAISYEEPSCARWVIYVLHRLGRLTSNWPEATVAASALLDALASGADRSAFRELLARGLERRPPRERDDLRRLIAGSTNENAMVLARLLEPEPARSETAPAEPQAAPPASPPKEARATPLYARTFEYAQLEAGFRRVVWSPDGTVLAVGCRDGLIRIIDMVERAMVSVIPGAAGGVYGLAWSPDGGSIAAGDMQGVISVWDVVNLRLASRVQVEPRATVFGLAWSPHGDAIAFGSSAGVVGTIDLTRNYVNQQVAAKGEVHTVAWSPDGSRIVTASSDGPH